MAKQKRQQKAKEHDQADATTRYGVLVAKSEGRPGRISMQPESPLLDLFEDRAILLGVFDPMLNLMPAMVEDEAGQAGAQRAMEQAAAFLLDVKPTNALEGALAAQMFACHQLVMNSAVRARQSRLAPHVDSAINQTVKLQRTFALQLEALAKLRGEKTSKQEITVRHATGDNVVPFPEGGGGGEEKTGTSP